MIWILSILSSIYHTWQKHSGCFSGTSNFERKYRTFSALPRGPGRVSGSEKKRSPTSQSGARGPAIGLWVMTRDDSIVYALGRHWGDGRSAPRSECIMLYCTYMIHYYGKIRVAFWPCHPAPRLSSLLCDGVLENVGGGASRPGPNASRTPPLRNSRACACRT